MMDYTRWVGCTCIAIVIISILWFSNVGLSEHFPSLWLLDWEKKFLLPCGCALALSVRNLMYRVLEPQPSHFWALDLIKECLDRRFTLSANLVGWASV